MKPLHASAPRRPARSCPPRARRLHASFAATPYEVLFAYRDVAAAREAMDEVSRRLRAHKPRLRLAPMLWRFDQLAHSRWRSLAAADGARAGLVVIAADSTELLPEAVDAWLSDVLVSKPSGELRVLILADGEEPWTLSLQHAAPAQRADAFEFLRPPATTNVRHENPLLASAV